MILVFTLVILCGGLILGMSVPLAFGLTMIYLAWAGGHDVTTLLPSGHWRMNALVLLAIPLFIMAGGLMERGKIAAPLVALAELFVGRIRGGLSAAAVVASAVFGSISGSASATLTCIGSIMTPRLREAGYPRGISAAIIASRRRR